MLLYLPDIDEKNTAKAAKQHKQILRDKLITPKLFIEFFRIFKLFIQV